MVLSVVAMSGFGLAADVPRGGPTATFDPGVGGNNDIVVSQQKPVVFRGEDGINFVDTQGNQIDPGTLVGVAGDAEGQPLESPIPKDQALGQYTQNGQAARPGVTVQQPRVTDLNVYNERGVDVAGSSVQENQVLLIEGEWNFKQAEDLSLVLQDQNGNNITGDVLTDASGLSTQQRNKLTGAYAQFPAKVERVIESLPKEAAGFGNCVQQYQRPARRSFGQRLLECGGDRDSTVVRAS